MRTVLADAGTTWQAAATCVGFAAVLAALITAQRALSAQKKALRADGRRAAAVEVAKWAHAAEGAVARTFDMETYRIPVVPPEGYVPPSAYEPGEVAPPSHARFGAPIEAARERYDPVRALVRLTFGAKHEVTDLTNEVIAALKRMAERGYVYTEDEGTPPQHYFERVFRPLVEDLIEALADACELRAPSERRPRSGLRADREPPQGS